MKKKKTKKLIILKKKNIKSISKKGKSPVFKKDY